ncbi:MAG: hypothetical protein EOP24_26120 [Hyphomicrobiales bacterium]|nr:MAG: hypothetical protein EOP24_26120 [Hyphomicrobiales bacterium]
MKAALLLVAALLATASASADVVAEGNTNNANGVIRLTNEQSNCATDSRFMYVRTATGTVYPGCWKVQHGDILAVFRDGDVMLYRIDGFTWNIPSQQKQRGSSL